MNLPSELNNLGVSFLESGDAAGAFEAFREAVDRMNSVAAHCSDAKGAKEPTSFPNKSFPSGCLLSFRNDIEVPRAKRDNISADLSIFVSKEAFGLLECCSVQSPTLDTIWRSSILLHNLALAMHLIGIETGHHPSLRKALKLYRFSKKLIVAYLEADDRKESDEVGTTNTRVVMSILNNMGQIHHELQHYDTARDYFDCLTQMLAAHDSTDMKAKERCNHVGLLLNALLLRQEPSVAAAA
eukprot:CAMPEP_0116832436 /NCGR_PEP_ID=MMETSP0418-20121206/5891_1 /TAXON_ID=1158023 /ORGANISM="Astrosyne radiata, Strain 13vi08-1A" /LENGTH=240 /DNA_ID=CAMNT_0004461797 /DNA_START=72 /DNA_END=794 /DNA_ORIENTATION=+